MGRTNTNLDGQWSTTSKCSFYFLLLLVELLFAGVIGLMFYWTYQYRGGLEWSNNIGVMFNFHPLLMVCGYVFLLAQSILVYRALRCCTHSVNKCAHAIIHALAVGAYVIAAIAVFEFHNRSTPPIPNLYSLHSWLGIASFGFFVLQFLFGFFVFGLAMFCPNLGDFRAMVLPVHVHFGLVTFLLAIGACVTGLTEKAIWTMGVDYSRGTFQGLTVNLIGIGLVTIGILVTFIVRNSNYRLAADHVELSERL